MSTPFSSMIARLTETFLPGYVVRRMRVGREWRRWVASITPEILDDLAHAPTEIKKRLFKSYVKLVEIEANAKCNRVCSFCPNIVVDRRRNHTLTDAKLLDRVFEDLGSIDYAQRIRFARYSEPLSNVRYLLDRIRSARRLVPHAVLDVVTNTDYLKRSTLAQLRDAGLNKLYMSIYLKPSEKWTSELARVYGERLEKKLGTPITSRSETDVSVRCTYKYEGVELVSSCRNFDEYGVDRGSMLAQYTGESRAGPCREPFWTFIIDYTGAVMPCCNLRSDLDEHKGFIVGDLTNPATTIFDIYAGRLAEWRQSLVGFGSKEHPCQTCRHRDLPSEFIGPISGHLNRQLQRIGRGNLL